MKQGIQATCRLPAEQHWLASQCAPCKGGWVSIATSSLPETHPHPSLPLEGEGVSSRSENRYTHGFTLVEMVAVILITGIIAGAVAMFIRLPVLGYVQSEARGELSDTADTALRRIGRELRLALPNSIRRTTDASQRIYLEFLPTKTGGRYLAEDEDPALGQALSFTDASMTTFTVIGAMPTGAQSIGAGDSIVVYNLGPGFNPANAYDCCNRAEVASITTNSIGLVSNPFASQSATTSDPYFASPSSQFQVLDSSPVTYVCDPAAKTLTRISGYAIQAIQPADVSTAPLDSATKALLATGVSACEFSYDNTAASLNSQRSGLVGLGLTLQTPHSSGEAVTLFHQVHVDNTP